MPRGRRRSRRNEQVPGYVWMLGGFSLGLIVALGIYLSQHSPGNSVANRPAAAANAAPTRQATVQPTQTAPAPSDSAAPIDPASPSEAATAAATTQFEFYDVLPEFEVVVPDTGGELRADPRATAQARSGNYIIQTGAFNTTADADRMQARLALLGFESNIQRVAIDDNVYHRVRIGPVGDLGELNRIRRRLRDERIEYLLIGTPE